MLEALKGKAASLTPLQKVVVLAYDEMSLKENVCFNASMDTVEGLEDVGGSGNGSGLLANHAGVFMVRSLTEKWKQPMGYFLTNGTMAPKTIKEKVTQAVEKQQTIGLDPRVLLCDQGSNRSAVTSLGVTKDRPYFVVNGKKIYVLYDTPHLVKNIRTNLKKHGFKVGEKNIKWEHLQQLYKYDSSKKIRMVPKLTEKHLELPMFSSMSVPLAAQV